MSGKFPVMLWYAILVFLSATAPQQNTLAMTLPRSLAFSVGPKSEFAHVLIGITLGNVYCYIGASTGDWPGSVVPSLFFVGAVLLIPWRGRFICPLAVAGLGLRYLHISSLLMFGHPLRKPFLVAFNNVDIYGLHSNWCANFTAFA